MKRFLVYLLSLLMLTAQAEDLSTPADILLPSSEEVLVSEELLISEAVDEPVDEFAPFQIEEEPPDETELLIQEDIHIYYQPTTDLDEQLIIEPETEAEDEVRFYYTVTCYTTKTSLTYIFTPVATPNLQENTEEQNQTNTGTQENTP